MIHPKILNKLFTYSICYLFLFGGFTVLFGAENLAKELHFFLPNGDLNRIHHYEYNTEGAEQVQF